MEVPVVVDCAVAAVGIAIAAPSASVRVIRIFFIVDYRIKLMFSIVYDSLTRRP